MIDGFAAGPNNSVDFIPASTRGDQRFGREQLALMDSIGTMLLGRVTYGMFAGYWPNVTEGDEKSFADKFNAMLKIVFSRADALDRGAISVKYQQRALRPAAAASGVKGAGQHPGRLR